MQLAVVLLGECCLVTVLCIVQLQGTQAVESSLCIMSCAGLLLYLIACGEREFWTSHNKYIFSC
jgi:hypothetical protein